MFLLGQQLLLAELSKLLIDRWGYPIDGIAT